jgi:hypothetical protein
MNSNNQNNTGQTYFDKRVPEEDCPIIVDPETQESYYNLDKIFENFFEENFLSTAKVTRH